AKPLFYEIFSARLGPEVTEEAWEKYATERVGQYVYTQYPYDIKDRIYSMFGGHPVTLSATGEHKLMQCRHHALVAQTLLEGFGIESRLVKNNVTFDQTKTPNLRPHASNSVRIGKKWYLFDATAPEIRPDGKAYVFLKEVPETAINLNANTYNWRFREANGRTRVYQSRSNMYYRIGDNTSHSTRINQSPSR
ncbi:MAG: transglutaminase domain-containing protein, partial [Candidatus Levybacteria bacterium]|nr:transglutaminase domain-containing protein [Candidatus Levybacteria bacterium]